jgi:hypothetical protein
MSSIPSTLYNNVWRKSNVLYITYIVAGCVIIEGIYGSFTNMLWDSYNSGVSGPLALRGHSRKHRSPPFPLPNTNIPPLNPLNLFIPQKLYKQIDWTKFKSEDDDEEEE